MLHVHFCFLQKHLPTLLCSVRFSLRIQAVHIREQWNSLFKWKKTFRFPCSFQERFCLREKVFIIWQDNPKRQKLWKKQVNLPATIQKLQQSHFIGKEDLSLHLPTIPKLHLLFMKSVSGIQKKIFRTVCAHFTICLFCMQGNLFTD